MCSSDVEVAAAKPLGRFYERVIEAAGVAPAEIVFVGDQLERDVIGPSAAGMRAILAGSRRLRHSITCALHEKPGLPARSRLAPVRRAA